jgi:hypothetical protein
LTLFAIWLVACLLIGMVAASRNRSAGGWTILAFFISPLLAGMILLLVGRRELTADEKHMADPLAAMTRKPEVFMAYGTESATPMSRGGMIIFAAFLLLVLALVLGLGALAIWVQPVGAVRERTDLPAITARTLIVAPEPDPTAWATFWEDRALALVNLTPL